MQVSQSGAPWGAKSTAPGGILEEIHRFSCGEDQYFLTLDIERPDAERVAPLTYQARARSSAPFGILCPPRSWSVLSTAYTRAWSGPGF